MHHPGERLKSLSTKKTAVLIGMLCSRSSSQIHLKSEEDGMKAEGTSI